VSLRCAAARLVFRFARVRMARRLAAWVFAHMSFVLPVQRLYESERLVAFYHPRPSYPVHILIVPKEGIASLQSAGAADGDLLAEVVRVAGKLAAELRLEQPGYRLIANGGGYQHIPQLHFHLVSG